MQLCNDISPYYQPEPRQLGKDISTYDQPEPRQLGRIYPKHISLNQGSWPRIYPEDISLTQLSWAGYFSLNQLSWLRIYLSLIQLPPSELGNLIFRHPKSVGNILLNLVHPTMDFRAHGIRQRNSALSAGICDGRA